MSGANTVAMLSYWWAPVIALTLWWLSTALLLFLNHLPRKTYLASMAIISIAMLYCFSRISVVSESTSYPYIILAFIQGLVIWAWLEMSYFMGLITGPSNSACPPGVTGMMRFRKGLATSLYHECLVILFGVVLVLVSWNAINPIAAYTFCTLWLMRWSAKLNLFFGVPNVNEDWFPEHLQYLSSYIRRRSITVVFPLTLTVAIASELAILHRGVFAVAEPLRFGFFLVASLLALGILEHLFMVLPFRDARLWNWAKKAADRHGGGHA